MPKRTNPKATPPATTAPADSSATAAFRTARDGIRATRGRIRLTAEELETGERFRSGAEERLAEGREGAYEAVEKAERRIRRATAELRGLRVAERRQIIDAVPSAVAYRDELIRAKAEARHELAVRIGEAIDEARATLTNALGKVAPIDPAHLAVARLSIDVGRHEPKSVGGFDNLDRLAFDAPSISVDQRRADRDPLTRLSVVLRDDLAVPLPSPLGTLARLAGVGHESVELHTMAYGASADDMSIIVRLTTDDDAELIRAARVILDTVAPAKAAA